MGTHRACLSVTSAYVGKPLRPVLQVRPSPRHHSKDGAIVLAALLGGPSVHELFQFPLNLLACHRSPHHHQHGLRSTYSNIQQFLTVPFFECINTP